MVTPDGFAKILDFGVVKLVPDPSGAPLAGADGSRRQDTRRARPGYGRVHVAEAGERRGVDFRSDQFSFGSILYEMLTGRRAFERPTPARDPDCDHPEEPAPVGAVKPDVPSRLSWILERCLAKDPRERYVATKDLAREVRSIRDHLSDATAAVPSAAPTGRSRSRAAILAAAAVVLLAAGIFAGLLLGRGSSREPPSYNRLSFRRGAVWSARFAPDGQTIVYSAAWDGEPMKVFSTRPEGIESRPLDLPSGQILAISSQGEMALAVEPRIPLSYFQIGTLALAALSGGAPRETLPDVHGADWSPDGKELAVLRLVEGKDRLEFPAGKVLYEPAGYLSDPRVSPDGKWIALMEHATDSTSVIAVGRDGGKKELSSGWAVHSTGLAWSPKGDEIWFSAARGREALALYAQSLTGRPRLLLRTPAYLKLFDIARDGLLLAAQLHQRVGLRFGSEGKPESELSWLSNSFLGDLSSDGRTVVFSEFQTLSSEPGVVVYLRKTDGSSAVRLGEGYSLTSMAPSPDGRWVLAISVTRQPGRPVLLPTGAGEAKVLAEISNCLWADWFPDGRRILVVSQPSDRAGERAARP